MNLYVHPADPARDDSAADCPHSRTLMMTIDLYRDILRISHEPHHYHDERTVHCALMSDPAAYYRHVRTFLQDLAFGRATAVLPPKQLMEDSRGDGDFRSMPCITERGDAVCKTVKIVGTNLRQLDVSDQITVGKAFRLHPVENFITDIFEACLLSSARTGLCVAIGLELLHARASSLAVVGCGRVGYYIARLAVEAAPLERIVLVDCEPRRAEQLAEHLRVEMPGVALSTSALLPAGIDCVALATTSCEALLGPHDSDCRLVISVGADTDNQSELHSDWSGCPVFVDTLDSMSFGDLSRWEKSGAIDRRKVRDIFYLLREGGSEAGPGERMVYVSTGSALFDNLTISYLGSNPAIGKAG